MWYILAGIGLIALGVSKILPKKSKPYQYFAQSSEWYHNQQNKNKK